MRWQRRCTRYLTVHKTGRNGPKKCGAGRGDRSYRGMASAYTGHLARWTGKANKQQRTGCTKCNEVSGFAKVAEGWVRETGGAEQGT